MARSWFVQPEVVRLPLPDGQFLDVKKELTAGEQRGQFTDLIKTMRAGEAAEIDPKLVGVTKIVAYVLGWSLTDPAGAPVPFSASALDNLSSDKFAVIAKAIEEHEAGVLKAREERKNDQDGETTSSPISPSVN